MLDRTDLAQLLDELAEPADHSSAGRRWHCPLPDHDDHHPSVTMHTDHRGHERWRCWSGDGSHRGDAIDLVAATQRVPRADAVDWLARRAGMIPDQPLPPSRAKAAAGHVRGSSRSTRPSFDTPTACERILWTAGGRDVREWLHGRGFDDDLLRANHVGADPGRAMLHRRRGLPYGATSGRRVSRPSTPPAASATSRPATSNQATARSTTTPRPTLGSNPRLAWTRTTWAPEPGCSSSAKASPTR